MKKSFLYTLFILLFISHFNIQAQSFPLQGATWIFTSNGDYSVDAIAQKWEYVGDSISSDETYKVMQVTTKLVNPQWIYPDSTVVIQESHYFFYNGDEIWDLKDSLSPLANFSLNVGDSAFTPYHSTQSPFYPLVFESNCSEEVVNLFFQKGVVVEAGTELEDDIEYRYYELKFKNELGETITRKFSERSILTEGFWHYSNQYLSDCSITDAPSYSFVCYRDDFSSDLSCEESVEWFESLNIKEELLEVRFEVFPNPVQDDATIKWELSGELQNLQYSLSDLNGREILNGTLNGNKGEKTIDVRTLKQGTYIIGIYNSNQLKMNMKLVKLK